MKPVVEHSRPAGVGSNLIEQIIAMTIVSMSLLALLGAVGAASRAVSSGRQRSIAVAMAKQTLENLEGSAYTTIAMNVASPGLTADPLISGSSPNLKFEGEFLVPGAAAPYASTTTSSGATFTVRTFITAVTPANGTAYRRITVFVDWLVPPSTTASQLRLSSFVFPLNYASYPSSNGSAVAAGALMTVNGQLGGETLTDVHVALPATRTDTGASTLRTAIGIAVSSMSHVDVGTGVVGSASCPSTGEPGVGDCPTSSSEAAADNLGSSTGGSWSATANQPFAAASLSTSGGLVVTTPAGLLTSRASTNVCGPCGFGDSDGEPWADASVSTSTATTATFRSDNGQGVLSGELWSLGAGWGSATSVDHDPTGGGLVTSTAQLTVPSLRVLTMSGAPAGFNGAVRVGGFTAGSTIASGYTLVAPVLTATPATVELWDGVGYRSVVVTPGVAVDESATATIVVGDHQVTFFSRVRSHASTSSMVGTAPRTDAVAQLPSVLVVNVDVTVMSLATTLVTDSFSIAVDDGYVSAHGEWAARAAS